MAVITCPDCGGSVSDAAPACIHCGRPMAAAATSPPPFATPAYASPAYSAPAAAPVDPMDRRAAEKAARAAATKPVAMIAYVLMGLSFAYAIPGIVALVVAYVKRGDAQGTWVESHFEWQIQTFWTGIAFVIVAAVLGGVLAIMTDVPELAGVGAALVVFPLIIWYVYRVVRGALALYEGRSVP